MGQPTRHDPYAALRILNFRWFIYSMLAMTVATQIQAVVVSWQIYGLTHDPLSLGLIGLAEAVPFIGFALFAGHVADRIARLRISLIALAVLLGCSLTLLGFTLRPDIIRPGRVWPIYLVIFCSGIARRFLQPARSALGAEVVGPAVGGLVYGFGSARAAYGVDAALIGVALLALARLRHAPVRSIRADESFLQSLATGIRFVRGQPVVLGALTLDLFSLLF